MRARSIFPAFLLGLLAFLVYRATAAPGLLPADAGEFQLTLARLGLSHPTGYPFYHLLGWLWDRLYLANPAQGANHFSALWGGVAVALVYLLLAEALGQLTARLKWQGGAGWLAGIGALFFALNPTFWAHATHAEVYTLHIALIAGLLAAALAAGREEEESPGRLWPVALLAGLSLTHHLTALLLLPAVGLYLWMTASNRRRGARPLRLAAFVLAPLLLYLYVPLRGPATPWLHPTLAPGQTLALFDSSPLGVLRFILGVGFAPALRDPAAALAQMPHAAALLLQHFGWPGFLLILLGLAALALEGRLALLAFSGLGFLSVVAFNLFYGIGDIEPFYLPAYLIATLWLTLGLAYAVDLVTRATSTRLRPLLLTLTALALILPALQWPAARASFDKRLAVETRLRWQTILAQPLPADAILVSNDRDEMVPLLYVQQIEGQAPGLTGLFPLISPDLAWADLRATLDSALATGRPVFTIKPMPGVEALYAVEALPGELLRVQGRRPAPDPSFEYPYGDYLRWLNLEWWGDALPGGELHITLYWRVTQTPPQTWHTFLQVFNAAGERIKQADDHRPGGVYLPSPQWRPSDVIVDSFTLPLPEELPPGGYTVVAGFYNPDTGARMADPLPVATLISPSSRPRR